MKKLIGIALILMGTTFCVSTPYPGVIFTSTSQSINNTKPSNIIGNARVEKMGESCSWSSWVLVTFFYYGGGASINEAAGQAGIKKIAVVDRSSLVFLGPIFYRECVQVWGE